MSKKKKFLIGLVVVVVLLQFYRGKGNNGSALGGNDITQVVATSPGVLQILQASCFDCHSDHTKYPWYTNVQPLGMWIDHHVNEGKEELNFSSFKSYSLKRQQHKLKEVIEQLDEGEMPLSSYTLIHGEAKLDVAHKQALIDWAKSGLTALGGSLEEEE